MATQKTSQKATQKIRTKQLKTIHCKLCGKPIIQHDSILSGICLSCSRLEADRKEKERMDSINSISLNQGENNSNQNPAYSPMPFTQEEINGWLTMTQLKPFFTSKHTKN